MSNIYIDLGAGDGDTILQFRNWRGLLNIHYPDSYKDWIAYGFEPNPAMERKWKRHIKEDTIIKKEAAWTTDGVITLSIGQPYYKSSVMKEKKDYQEGKKMVVPCFDFSKWIEQFRGDTVILKMDIEGAELPILTKMMEDGTDTIPTVTFVEWHDGKMPTYHSNKHVILDKYKGNIREWR